MNKSSFIKMLIRTRIVSLLVLILLFLRLVAFNDGGTYQLIINYALIVLVVVNAILIYLKYFSKNSNYTS